MRLSTRFGRLAAVVVASSLSASLPPLHAQVTAPISAPSDVRSGLFAVTAARVYVTPDRVLDNATVIVRDGRVIDVGVGLPIPAGAVQTTFGDKTIVPAFVDLMSTYGQPEVKPSTRDRRNAQYETTTAGPYSWNEALKAEYEAAANFTHDAKRAEALRKLGFGTVLAHRPDGISRGSAALVALSTAPPQEALLKSRAAHVMSFQKGSSAQMYPSSLMGMIALLRQTYLDADWYGRVGMKEERNLSLDAWRALAGLPQLFVVGDKLEAMRALKIAEEFKQDYVLVGQGDEYQRLDGFTGKQRFVLPLTFPDAFDVADPYDAVMVDYTDMLHWELADANAAYLRQAGHDLAFTLNGLGEKDEKTLFERLDRVRAAGLSEADLLRALTTAPAAWLGVGDEVGTLEKGRVASFVVLDKWPVDKDAKVYETWVQGERFEVTRPEADVPQGDYRVVVGQRDFTLDVAKGGKATITPGGDTLKIEAKLARELDRISLNFAVDSTKSAPRLRLAGRIDGLGNWSGMGFDERGQWIAWTATRDTSNPQRDTSKTKALTSVKTLPVLPKPFGAFGQEVLPKGESFVVRGATVWTNEADGILDNADVYVVGGKISAVGKTLKVPDGVRSVDGAGKHITSGIIDEHSHIAISRGVNEGSQESSAEVRIGDVINSEDVNLYRHLAGGVTAIQQLHGSANPIGGQSALIKLRWGMLPEQLKIDGADAHIKFALGENVKQSNWGINTTRYPQTRMGVEQVFDDYFTRAAAYAKTRQRDPGSRRDLDLEALAEILAEKRFITCHSYKASEIHMLMDVADRHDFRVNTFTHILEGYKVADKMKAHGVGASTFSDWWAYKFEVWDAIPQNGPIMHDEGLVVAYNSDDAELGRRLNQDAAKAVQFGGLSEEEAWKFVTLNPAKLLHLDKRTGSIRAGKDADLVLWNAHPMSVYASADKTWVDGTLYFDRADMRARQAKLVQERNRLAQAMLDAKQAGKRTRPVEMRGGQLDHCDALHGAE